MYQQRKEVRRADWCGVIDAPAAPTQQLSSPPSASIMQTSSHPQPVACNNDRYAALISGQLSYGRPTAPATEQQHLPLLISFSRHLRHRRSCTRAQLRLEHQHKQSQPNAYLGITATWYPQPDLHHFTCTNDMSHSSCTRNSFQLSVGSAHATSIEDPKSLARGLMS